MRRAINAAVGVVAVTFMALAQQPGAPPSKYQPSEVQVLKLKVKQLEALNAGKDFQAAQQIYQQKMSALTEQAQQIETENKWPTTLAFDPNSLTFNERPEPPAPPKAEEKKK